IMQLPRCTARARTKQMVPDKSFSKLLLSYDFTLNLKSPCVRCVSFATTFQTTLYSPVGSCGTETTSSVLSFLSTQQSFRSTCLPLASSTWIVLNVGSISSLNQHFTSVRGFCNAAPTFGYAWSSNPCASPASSPH